MTALGSPPVSAHDAWETPERRELRALVRRFTEREIVPHLDAWEDAGELPRSLHRRSGELGLLALGFPEDAGGDGGHLDTALVAEELILAGGSSGVCAGLFTHGIAAPHIALNGSTELVDRFVRPTLRGELIGSLGITEPGTGSDVAGITTRAVRDGEDYLVTGEKTFITSGARADFVTTAVRTGGPGHRGVSLLVVETDRPGVARTKLRKMGWHCSDTATIHYDEVRVPATNLVGAEGSGFRQIMERFASERLSLAVQAYATALRCVELTIAWARQRETFGAPLSSRQVVRHRIAQMARRATVARTYVRDVLARYEAGADVVTELAMAKNAAVEACDQVVDAAVQLHGGAGYLHGVEVERHYRDARILGIGGGTNEIMDEVIAGRLGLDG
ncbi:acyl-CoA dehydrogenase family protein [Actinomycetospora endophytica]|uniref:Acyl-CoA dehydrogenase family protein n=1 Tax=Actinomycetospora endophytica TaxID=2291215 RepID=A0ABS8P3F8_9PSEU|nr:acyl-CoA dehydrogenase family protein [Actinomycetospora endophytica]MCD2192773.1 acyl-CoA dehydrogenase family protein [Actinomycetospora endophytica]